METVILPAYKPDNRLPALVDELCSYGCHIVVVDDGSGETYRQVFEELRDVCTVLVHEENRGKGAAIKTALAYVREEMPDCDCIGIMDSDGQHRPEDMLRLLEAAHIHEDSLILGVREVGKEMPFRSQFGNGITRQIFRLASGVWVSDTQTGLRAFGAIFLDEMLAVKGERYEYEMNMLLHFARKRVPFKEVKIATLYHDRENSCSHFRVIRDSLRIYKDIIRFTLSSLSSFIVDYLLFAVFMFLFPHTPVTVLLGNVAARAVSAVYNYSMNCRFVFHRKKEFSTAMDYFALAGMILLFNNLLLELLVQAVRMPVYLAKLLTECLLFVISWMVQTFVIFQKGKRLDAKGGTAV